VDRAVNVLHKAFVGSEGNARSIVG
jgi:hypothetical protein